jgi:hypothetical protein
MGCSSSTTRSTCSTRAAQTSPSDVLWCGAACAAVLVPWSAGLTAKHCMYVLVGVQSLSTCCDVQQIYALSGSSRSAALPQSCLFTSVQTRTAQHTGCVQLPWCRGC